MKFLILIIGMFLISECAMSQDTIKNTVSVITLPSQSKKTSKNEYVNYAKREFKIDRNPFSNDRYFKKDGLLILIRETTLSTPKSLEIRKKELDGVFQIQPNTSTVRESKIINVNNIQYIVFNYTENDEGHLSLYSDIVNNKIVMALIDYKVADEQKAHDYLYKLLQKLQFKNK